MVVAILVVCAFAFAQDSTSSMGGSKMKSMSKSKAKTTKMSGYLVDASCAKDMAMNADSSMIKAEKHTKKCALMDMCVASGYGMMSGGKWYKFDAKGDAKAQAVIEKSTKKNGIMAQVTGTMTGDTFTVVSIKETTEKKPTTKKSSM